MAATAATTTGTRSNTIPPGYYGRLDSEWTAARYLYKEQRKASPFLRGNETGPAWHLMGSVSK